MSRQQQPPEPNDLDYGWTDDARAEYEAYLEQQRDLPPHKRDGYAERMADHADMMRKAEREDQLLRSIK